MEDQNDFIKGHAFRAQVLRVMAVQIRRQIHLDSNTKGASKAYLKHLKSNIKALELLRDRFVDEYHAGIDNVEFMANGHVYTDPNAPGLPAPIPSTDYGKINPKRLKIKIGSLLIDGKRPNQLKAVELLGKKIQGKWWYCSDVSQGSIGWHESVKGEWVRRKDKDAQVVLDTAYLDGFDSLAGSRKVLSAIKAAMPLQIPKPK